MQVPHCLRSDDLDCCISFKQQQLTVFNEALIDRLYVFGLVKSKRFIL